MNKLLAAVTVLVVSTTHAAGDGSEAEPYCSIQTAIDNAVDTDEIVVAPGTYFETIYFNGKAIWLHSSDGAPSAPRFHGSLAVKGAESPPNADELRSHRVKPR